MANIKDKPVCFIAMAFDHEDTDYLYENQILPVLKRNGIKPIIINRHQSNDDLNIQIIDQLQGADFCITDLTYARQSVYFEAGYAQRTISVIYTVRKDHLNSGQPDHLRVHFDLQMKPLISWKSQNDPTFAERLEQRIKKTFLIHWNRSQTEQSNYQEYVEKFNALPLDDRLTILRRQTIKSLQRLGFSSQTWSSTNMFYHQKGAYGLSTIRNGAYNHINAHKISKGIANFVSIQSFQSLAKKDIYEFMGYYSEYHVADELKRKAGKLGIRHLKVIYHDNIFLSIKPVTIEKFANNFREFTPLRDPLRYYKEDSDYPKFSGSAKVLVKSTYYFLGGIKSIIHLNEQIKMAEQQIAQHLS